MSIIFESAIKTRLFCELCSKDWYGVQERETNAANMHTINYYYPFICIIVHQFYLIFQL